ncbi:MAG: hypothetical protein JWQ87_5334 [Candidatus Sulfotelmatobacter sp.]|nr:hypothetical protein [Candidatus Sulfotelmatobacter sp.]
MPTPAQVVTAFQNQVASTLNLYDQLFAAVAPSPQKKTLESMLAEQCVLGIAVQWEAFLHDLIVSYIEQSPTVCVDHHKKKVGDAITKSKNALFLAWITYTIPSPLTRVHIEEMVDPKGWNITADSGDSLAALTGNLLPAPASKKFSLPAVDRKFIDLTIAFRNYLSHRSGGSVATLKDKLALFQKADKASPLRGRITHVGTFLKFTPKGAPGTRAAVIGLNLSALAGKLI